MHAIYHDLKFSCPLHVVYSLQILTTLSFFFFHQPPFCFLSLVSRFAFNTRTECAVRLNISAQGYLGQYLPDGYILDDMRPFALYELLSPPVCFVSLPHAY